MTDKNTILLIDDDEAVLKSLGVWLKNEGYAVCTARNGEEAREVLKKQAVDLCLVDLRLKNEDGVKLSTELRRIDENLKIIILTGYATYETAVEALKAGLFDYTSKTSEPAALLQKIRSALAERTAQVKGKKRNPGQAHNLVLVGHHVLIREGLQKFCKENPEFQFLHTYYDCDYVNKNDFSLEANLLLLCAVCNQARLDEPVDTLFKMKLVFPNARPVLINSEHDPQKTEALIRAGIKGVLPANISKESMKKALLAVASGQLWVSRHIADKLLAQLLDQNGAADFKKPTPLFKLSKREVEILQALASGLSNFEISEKLYLSEMTIKTHIHHIFEKMEVKTRTQAVLKALECHII